MNGGDTEVRTLSTESTPAGVEGDGLFTNITFPTAPVAMTAFTVATPVEGETRSDFLNLVPYTGTGGPGNTITIEYFGAGGVLATAGTGTVDQDGTYRVLTNFEELTPGATFVQSFVGQTTPEDTSAARDISRSFNFATAPVAAFPFTITSPETGETVDSVTPTFVGTATPGNTVRIVYSGVGLLNYTAGESIVDEDGNFSVPTSFEDLTPGETETRVAVIQLDVNGNEIDRLYKLFNFPEAPVAAPAEALAAPVLNEAVVDGGNVTLSGTGIAGATVEILVAGSTADDSEPASQLPSSTTVTTTVGTDGTFSVIKAFENGTYSATATQFTGNGDDRSAATADVSFTVAVAAAPATPATPAAAAMSTGSADALAYTGQELVGPSALAGLLLLAGGGLLIARRRKSTPAADTDSE